MPETSKKINHKVQKRSELESDLCIDFPAQLHEFSLKVFIDLSSKVNVIQLSSIRKLALHIWKTYVDT